MVLHVLCRLKMPDAIPISRKALLRSISPQQLHFHSQQVPIHPPPEHRPQPFYLVHTPGRIEAGHHTTLPAHHINLDKYSNIYKELPSGRRMRMKLNSGNKLERIFLLSWSTQHPYQAFWSLQTMDHQNLKQSAGKEQNVFYK